MSFNPEKCEIIRIANIKHPIVHDHTIQEKKIKVASSVKYLGVYMYTKPIQLEYFTEEY